MEKEKSELERVVVYNTVYIPVRFFNKEAYIHIDDYKEVRDKRGKAVEGLEQENKKLKEERDNFMLKYVKAVEEKVVETNNLCTERNKLIEENRKLKKYYDRDKEELAESCYDLARENQNLKNEIMGYKKIESKLNNVIKTLKEENKRLSDFLECES